MIHIRSEREPIGHVTAPLRVSHVLTPEAAVVLSALAVTVKDAGLGTTISSGISAIGSAAYTVENANGHRIWFDVAQGTAMDLRYVLTGLAGSEPWHHAGRALIWPLWSAMDRYIDVMKGKLQEAPTSEQQQNLSLRDYRDSLALALARYNVDGSTSYALTHTTDEVPAAGYQAVAWYAAALALLGPSAAGYLRTSSPEVGAGFINREPRSSSAVAIAKEWFKMINALWPAGANGLQTGVMTLSDPSPWSTYTGGL